MAVTPAEREYAEAKAAFLAAQKRLKTAKAAMPSKRELSDQRWVERKRRRVQRETAMWTRYLAGVRNIKTLAAEFGLSVGYTARTINHIRWLRQFGPPTEQEALWSARWAK
jgi:hypothetical protein